MLAMLAFTLTAALSFIAPSEGIHSNPLGVVTDLLNQLITKLERDGEAEAADYTKYAAWCDDATASAKFNIESVTAQREKLEASISKLSADIESCSMKIEELAATESSALADLKEATLVREKEASDFAASEKELMETADALDRAIKIMDREMQKGTASLAQLDSTNMENVLQSLSAVVSAASLPNADREKLLALAQSAEDGEENEPASEKNSAGIMDLLEDLKEKAEEQLSDLRKAEATGGHEHDMFKQSMEAEVAAAKKDMAEEKSIKAASEEAKASDEGDLAKAVEELNSMKVSQQTVHDECAQAAVDHKATEEARKEELKVINQALKTLAETTSNALMQTYSLMQVSANSKSKSKVVEFVKHLARDHHSVALAQLASRISAMVRYGAGNGEDPFAKVKGLVQDMIDKLEDEGGQQETEKAYCDGELAKTKAKNGELGDDVTKFSTKIDQATARLAELKEEVSELESELASMAKAQAEMDKIRQESHADYVLAKADLETGLGGVRKALSLLRGYYANKDGAVGMDQEEFSTIMKNPSAPPKHTKSTGAGSGIISILEVVESDFADNLAKEETKEADSQSEYDKVTQENKITKVTKEKDVTYKSQEMKSIDEGLTELSSSKDNADGELAAVNEYFARLKDRCIAKPEEYEDRKKRREAEIAGLKQALTILEGEEASFVQGAQRAIRRHFRGARAPSR